MAIFPMLRWAGQHRKWVRVIDYILGIAALGYGIWQHSWISIGIGIFCLLAAVINLAERFNFFLPRIVPPKKPPHA